MSVSNGMVFQVASKYRRALWRVEGVDDAEKFVDSHIARTAKGFLVLCLSSTTFEKLLKSKHLQLFLWFQCVLF